MFKPSFVGIGRWAADRRGRGRLVGFAVIWALLASLSGSARADDAQVRNELRLLYRKIYTANLDNDPDAALQITTKDWTYHDGQVTMDRDTMSMIILTSEHTAAAYQLDSVTVNGKSAVVHFWEVGKDAGTPWPTSGEASVDYWIKTRAGWRLQKSVGDPAGSRKHAPLKLANCDVIYSTLRPEPRVDFKPADARPFWDFPYTGSWKDQAGRTLSVQKGVAPTYSEYSGGTWWVAGKSLWFSRIGEKEESTARLRVLMEFTPIRGGTKLEVRRRAITFWSDDTMSRRSDPDLKGYTELGKVR